MFDLVTYTDADLSLILRSRKTYFVYAYPWKVPVACEPLLGDVRAEVLNVQEDRLFAELTVRARFCAFDQICRLARNGLNGRIPTSLQQIHTEALKFALKRFEKSLISGEDFVAMLRSAALIAPIPNGFWARLEQFLSADGLVKLRQSMQALAIFHEMSQEAWVVAVYTYMEKVVWFADDFDQIQTVCAQLAIINPDHGHKEMLVALGSKAKSMLTRARIEAEQANAKPWQRSGPGMKKTVRSGPPSKAAKKPSSEGEETKQ